MKHTLGPWEVRRGGGRMYVRRKDAPQGELAVCQIMTSAPENETIEANARLIASAPELLKASENAFLCFSNDPEWWAGKRDTKRWDDIRAEVLGALEVMLAIAQGFPRCLECGRPENEECGPMTTWELSGEPVHVSCKAH